MDCRLAARSQVHAGCVNLPALRRPAITTEDLSHDHRAQRALKPQASFRECARDCCEQLIRHVEAERRVHFDIRAAAPYRRLRSEHLVAGDDTPSDGLIEIKGSRSKADKLSPRLSA
jgi:hypothetical protein